MATASTFVHLAWLLPLAFAAHVVEEWYGGFPRWARRFASPNYSAAAYWRVHTAGLGVAFLYPLALTLWPQSGFIWSAFALVLAPGLFWNSTFHLGATAVSRTYCPGAVSATLLYLPLFGWLVHRGLDEGLLTPASTGIALGTSAVVHFLEVRQNVFRAGPEPHVITST